MRGALSLLFHQGLTKTNQKKSPDKGAYEYVCVQIINYCTKISSKALCLSNEGGPRSSLVQLPLTPHTPTAVTPYLSWFNEKNNNNKSLEREREIIESEKIMRGTKRKHNILS